MTQTEHVTADISSALSTFRTQWARVDAEPEVSYEAALSAWDGLMASPCQTRDDVVAKLAAFADLRPDDTDWGPGGSTLNDADFLHLWGLIRDARRLMAA